MQINKILYWLSTVVLTGIMVFSVYNYLFNYQVIIGFFEHLGFPVYLIYPLAIAKVLGLIAVWGNFSKSLREWAYCGFFFNTLLAFAAHYIIDKSGYLFAVIALSATLVSYFTAKKVRP